MRSSVVRCVRSLPILRRHGIPLTRNNLATLWHHNEGVNMRYFQRDPALGFWTGDEIRAFVSDLNRTASP